MSARDKEPLEFETEDLVLALGLGAREHVAIVGGGGKTSLLFALAEDLRLHGCPVVTGTTTKVRGREALRARNTVFAGPNGIQPGDIPRMLGRFGHVFVAQDLSGTGKVEGISCAFADALFECPGVPYLVLEADGSAGRPLKAPAEHEPAVPSSASLVVAMMGLEALGKCLEPDIVFRVTLFEKLTGLSAGSELTPRNLACVFSHPGGLFKRAPQAARRVAFLNKLDLLPDHRAPRELADRVRKGQNHVDRVVVGSILGRRYLVIRAKE